MPLPVPFLAAADAAPRFGGDAGMPVWQTLGGLLAVFGLLVVVLKVLGRLNRRQKSAAAQVLTVWPLGPRREIQVLRLGAEVHYIYRHDNAMVRLKEESLDVWQAAHAADAGGAEPPSWQRFLPGGGIFPRRAAAPGDLTSF